MGTQNTVELDHATVANEKDFELPTPGEMEPNPYPTSNLLILGAGFFALWAGSARSMKL
jgi:hypothetical protein